MQWGLTRLALQAARRILTILEPKGDQHEAKIEASTVTSAIGLYILIATMFVW